MTEGVATKRRGIGNITGSRWIPSPTRTQKVSSPFVQAERILYKSVKQGNISVDDTSYREAFRSWMRVISIMSHDG